MDKKIKEALDRAMALCSRSEKCVRDISEKLKLWGIESEDDINLIIEKLDEQRYANAYTSEKLRFNHWGRIKIGVMLSSRGISGSLIKEALSSINEELYHEILKEEILKKRRTIKGSNQFEIKGKLMRFAQSKGYETDIIFGIINEIGGN